MYIQFSYEQSFEDYLELPLNRRLPLVQAIPLLNSASSELTASNKEIAVDYLLFQDKAGDQSLLEATIHLPITEGTEIEAIQRPVIESDEYSDEDIAQFLSLFGKGKTKKKTVVKKQERPSEQENEVAQPVKSSFFKEKMIYILGAVLLVVISTGSFFFAYVQTQQTAELVETTTRLKEQLRVVEMKQAVAGELDTVSRFFLTNYLSGEQDEMIFQGQIEKYVKKDVIKGLTPTDAKVKSILPWTTEQKNKKWLVSYVITIEGKDKKTQMEKISFELEKAGDHFLVVSTPERENFTIN